MAGPIGGLGLIDAKAHHHVEMIRHQRIDHARRAGGIIGRIAIDQHVDVGIDVGEHAPDHMALALAAFAAHLGAGLARDLDGAVRRIVVVDEDFGRRQRLAKIGDHGRDRGFLVEARHQNRNPQLRWFGLREFPLRELRQRLRHAGEIAAQLALGSRRRSSAILNGVRVWSSDHRDRSLTISNAKLATPSFGASLIAPDLLTPDLLTPELLTPGRDRRLAFEHFRYPQPRALRWSPPAAPRREEAAGDDLAVRLRQPVLPEMPDHIDRDMVAAGDVAVEEHAVQHRLAASVRSAPPPSVRAAALRETSRRPRPRRPADASRRHSCA